MTVTDPSPETSPSDFELGTFLPYLVRVFSVDVASKVSGTYEARFNMSPAEWRVMAILGLDRSLSATQIVDRSSMDKVTVSRAVAKLVKRGWIRTEANDQDRRSKLLCLSADGTGVYSQIVPRVLAVETELLDGLTQEQIDTLIDLMDRIRQNCRS